MMFFKRCFSFSFIFHLLFFVPRLGIFNGCGTQVIISNPFESHSTWPNSNKGQDGNNLHTAYEKNETSSYESKPYQYSTWEEGMDIEKMFHKVSSIDSIAYMISGESCCLTNQLVEIEMFNETNDVNGHLPINNKMNYTMNYDRYYTLFDPIKSSQIVGYLEYECR